MKKSKEDLVRGWLRKADSDIANATLCLSAGTALDTACFHAQQAAEKCIKAYLSWQTVPFPFIHNLEKLLDLCIQKDASFQNIKVIGTGLTPYASDLRYDDSFWPVAQVARKALEDAKTIRDFILAHLPAAVRPASPTKP